MKTKDFGFKIQPNFTGIVEICDGSHCDAHYMNITYFKNGKVHRENWPAIEWADGSKKWYLNRKLHRTDGPACEYTNGDKFWYLNGKHYGKEKEYKAEVEKLKKTK
jgi:hypothetical protein